MHFDNKKLINKELSANEILLVTGGKKNKTKLPKIDAHVIKNPVQNDMHISAKVPINKYVDIGPYISTNMTNKKINGGGLAFSVNL